MWGLSCQSGSRCAGEGGGAEVLLSGVSDTFLAAVQIRRRVFVYLSVWEQGDVKDGKGLIADDGFCQ